MRIIRNIIREELSSLKNPIEDDMTDQNQPEQKVDSEKLKGDIDDMKKREKEELDSTNSEIEMKKKERSMKTSNDSSVNAERDKRLKMDIELLTKRAENTKKNMDSLNDIGNASSSV